MSWAASPQCPKVEPKGEKLVQRYRITATAGNAYISMRLAHMVSYLHI